MSSYLMPYASYSVSFVLIQRPNRNPGRKTYSHPHHRYRSRRSASHPTAPEAIAQNSGWSGCSWESGARRDRCLRRRPGWSGRKRARCRPVEWWFRWRRIPVASSSSFSRGAPAETTGTWPKSRRRWLLDRVSPPRAETGATCSSGTTSRWT